MKSNLIIDDSHRTVFLHPPAKLILKEGDMYIPCEYRVSLYADDHVVASGLVFVTSDEDPIAIHSIEVVRAVQIKSSDTNVPPEVINEYILRPLGEYKFVRYDGYEISFEVQEHISFLSLRIKKPKKRIYVHQFSLCR